MRLGIDGNRLLIRSPDGREVSVARFSKAFSGRLGKWEAAGYAPVEIVVRYILWWRGKDDERESLIFLPTIRLRRSEAP